jgi:hypothetical protein
MNWQNIRHTLPLAALCVALAACNASVNEDIEVPAGTRASGSAMTVNGDVNVAPGAEAAGSSFRTVNGEIRLGDGAQVADCATVNGTVDVGEGVRAGDLETVNGNLRLGRDSEVRGHIKVINGFVEVDTGSRVEGYVETVNGKIQLDGARVGGYVRNVNGGMLVTRGSVVEGDLVVKDPGEDRHGKRPRIVIGPDSKVLGALVFERPVELFVHETAQIGDVEGAEPVMFSGDEPG